MLCYKNIFIWNKLFEYLTKIDQHSRYNLVHKQDKNLSEQMLVYQLNRLKQYM